MASVVRSFSDLSAREVLALALDVERNNAQRIQKLADLHIGRDVAVQRVLLDMRDEELEHERMLEDVWRGRFGDEAKPPIKEIEVREVIEVVDVEAGMEFPLDETDVSDALDLVHRAGRRGLLPRRRRSNRRRRAAHPVQRAGRPGGRPHQPR